MRFLITGIIALSIITGTVALAKEESQIRGPLKVLRSPIELDKGKYHQLYVIFNHNTHKGIKCRLCHHMEGANGNIYAPCTSDGCHDMPGPRSSNPMSLFMAYHDPTVERSCYGCHKKEAAYYQQFKGCRPCHMSPQAKAEVSQPKVEVVKK